MKIKDIYNKKRLVLSLEFFPPKNERGLDVIFKIFEELKRFGIDYFSITSGAFGSPERGTVELAALLREKNNAEAMVHLTCINKSRQEIDRLLARIKVNKIENILALRGDPPLDSKKNIPLGEGYKYAFELVKHIKEFNNDFCVGVAAYPDGHPECRDLKKNLEYLKMKVEAGADFAITQLFLKPESFLKLRDEARKTGINIPLVPGILLVKKYSQLIFFSKKLGISPPKNFLKKLEAVKENLKETRKICMAYNIFLVKSLFKEGVPGFHFFTMNEVFGLPEILQEISENK